MTWLNKSGRNDKYNIHCTFRLKEERMAQIFSTPVKYNILKLKVVKVLSGYGRVLIVICAQVLLSKGAYPM